MDRISSDYFTFVWTDSAYTYTYYVIFINEIIVSFSINHFFLKDLLLLILSKLRSSGLHYFLGPSSVAGEIILIACLAYLMCQRFDFLQCQHALVSSQCRSRQYFTVSLQSTLAVIQAYLRSYSGYDRAAIRPGTWFIRPGWWSVQSGAGPTLCPVQTGQTNANNLVSETPAAPCKTLHAHAASTLHTHPAGCTKPPYIV